MCGFSFLGFLCRGLVSLGLLRFLLGCFCDDFFVFSIMFFISMMISSVAGITTSSVKAIGVLTK